MELKDLNWNHLYYFNELAKFQSLKKTAQFLELAPSTLSEHLKRLEHSLDSKLFIRSSKGLTLSDEGRDLYDRTKEVFEQGAKIIEPFREDSIGGYPVVVGIEQGFAHDLAVEFVGQYWDLYAPYGIVNTATESEHNYLIDNLLKGRIDWGLSYTKPKSKKLDYALVDHYRIKFCCSNELFSRFKDPKDILINIPFYDGNLNDNNERIEKYLARHKIYPKERLFSDHEDYVRHLCERGRCVMPIVENPLDDYRGLRTFSLDTELKISLYVVWNKKDNALLSIQKLKNLLQTKITQLPTRYDDIALQIEAADINQDLLK